MSVCNRPIRAKDLPGLAHPENTETALLAEKKKTRLYRISYAVCLHRRLIVLFIFVHILRGVYHHLYM